MSIGYACLAVGVPHTNQKTCILKNATPEHLAGLIAHNLQSLQNLIAYNAENGIKLFRISSDIVPFGSAPVNTLAWWDLFRPQLDAIGAQIRAAGMRVSMHPGQYTVLNSPDEQVVARAVDDLVYHCRFLDALGVNSTHKLILHVGGAYGDKQAAMTRFAENYVRLDEQIKRRLIIENDDKIFDVADVLALGNRLGIPVVFDNLHHRLHCCDASLDEFHWVAQCAKTWQAEDGRQKIHYSEQDVSKRVGSHAHSVDIEAFLQFFEGLDARKPDIMLELKDKNLSANKCINCTANMGIKALEREWSRYKYTVLERSPSDYLKIRELLKDKSAYPVREFYNIIEHAAAQELSAGNSVNAAGHVWGYFKDGASMAEKKRFATLSANLQGGGTSLAILKRFLFKLAEKYDVDYLLQSYYFNGII